jgi:hypothetical protein
MKISKFNEFILENKDNKNQYYVNWSSWFNAHKYDIEKIKEAAKKAGAERVRTGKQFGWSNQPDVVIFNSEGNNIKNIKNEIQKALDTQWIIISAKNW